MKHVEIDNLDSLPPERAQAGRVAPWHTPRTDWRVTAVRALFGLLAALLGYWLVGNDIKNWIRFGDGRWVVRGALALGFLWSVKRFILFDRVRGIPVGSRSLARVDAGALLRGILDVDHEYAGAVVPTQLTYSPHRDRHYATTEDNTDDQVIDMPSAPPINVLPHIPPALLLDWKERKLICQSDNSLLLGFDKAIGSIEPSSGVYLRLGEESDVALLAVSGDSGSGKTSTMRFLMAQAAMRGAAIVLCDPHGRDNQQSLVQSCAPLAGSFLQPPAVNWNDIHEAVQTVDRIGRNRLNHGAPDRQHIMLVIDEFSDVARNAPDIKDIARLLINIADNYRKVNLTAWLVVHHWRVNEWKSGTLKDAVQGVVFHRMAKSEAKLFVSDPVLTQQIHYLPHGDGMFFKRGQAQPTRLTGIPNVTRAHLAEAANLYAPAPRVLPSMQLTSPGTEAGKDAEPSGHTLQERLNTSGHTPAHERANLPQHAEYMDAGTGRGGHTGTSAPIGVDIPESDRVRLYLQAYAAAGMTRAEARERLAGLGMGFRDSEWTQARRDLGLN